MNKTNKLVWSMWWRCDVVHLFILFIHGKYENWHSSLKIWIHRPPYVVVKSNKLCADCGQMLSWLKFTNEKNCRTPNFIHLKTFHIILHPTIRYNLMFWPIDWEMMMLCHISHFDSTNGCNDFRPALVPLKWMVLLTEMDSLPSGTDKKGAVR